MNGPQTKGNAAASLAGMPSARWRAWIDNQTFRPRRQDYFDYLANLLDTMAGARTLKDILQNDVRRHGLGSVRGRLSWRWLQQFQASGGDLYATWQGCFPAHELALLRSAQARGNHAVVRALREMADIIGLLDHLRRSFFATLWSALLGVLLLSSMLLAVPGFTVPRLMSAFGGLPASYHGPLTRRLLDFAQWLDWLAPALLAVLMLVMAATLATLARRPGRLRRLLDGCGPWRLYRQVQGLRFMLMLAIFLRVGVDDAVTLRDALLQQRAGARDWLRHHIDAMLARLDTGTTGAAVFDVGLLERDAFWYLDDMLVSRGLTQGLGLASARLRRRIPEVFGRRALALRWGLLLFCVLAMLSLVLWHYAVIDELRRALMIFHATG